MNLNLIKDFQITLDLIKIQSNPIVQVKATDLNTIKFSFSVLDDGAIVDLTGTIVRLTVKKPFGTTVIQDCVITDAVNGKCEIILTNQAYIEVGNYTGELVITKDVDVTVTRSFEYSSLAAIFDDATVQSQNDWQSIHDIMLNNDLRPILGDGTPNMVVSPEYVGQTYLDTVGMIMYYASTMANDGWLPFGTGGAQGGGGPVYWVDVLSKPNTFPPETHTHIWTDITDKPTQFAPTAHQHDWGTGITNKPTEFAPSAHIHAIADVTGLTEALEVTTPLSKTGTTDPTGVVPDFAGQIYIDTTAKEAYVASSEAGDWQTISMDELGGGQGSVDWTAITSKPNTYPPDAHTHVSTEITDLTTVLDTKANVVHTHVWADLTDKPTTFTPSAHSHIWADITDKPTTFTPAVHTHVWADLTDKPTTFTPPVATTGLTGGIKVGNGLRMGGTNNEWLTLRDGVGIKTNSVSLAVDVDKPTLDGWYAKSTQGLSIWQGTQAEYDAIGSKDATTLYFVTG